MPKKTSLKEDSKTELMDKIISLAKRRGFVYQSSEIYGGINSIYDYGPLGMLLKNNLKQQWLKSMVQLHHNIVGLDSGILMHPKIWEASGHVEGFTDPLVDCKVCKKRFRADHLLEAKGIKPDFRPQDQMKDVKCPECGGELTEIRKFNLMFKTFMGAVEDEASQIYLRPETAQGIYVNFQNVLNSSRMKLPFGIAQIGKAFRNEITPGNFTFRMREFEQMEMQFFINPNEADKWFDYWQKERMNWYLSLGASKAKLKFREHEKNELAHYAKKAVDVEYNFPFDQRELEGIHNRGNWDLSRHQQFSGQNLEYQDLETKEKYIPYIIETSGGVDRAALMFLIDAYTEVEARSGDEEAKHETEVVLKLDKRLAPIKAAILPLSKKLESAAFKLYEDLRTHFMCQYDDTGSIGKRYRRQDEIGTPYSITYDFDSETDHKVTVRDRDTMEQQRIAIGELKDYLMEKLG